MSAAEWGRDLAIITGYGLVVAFTALPILSVIAILLSSRRASRGAWFVGGYAVGLALVFVLSSLGVAQLRWPPWAHPGGWFYVVAGALLIVGAAVWLLWDRRRTNRSSEPTTGGFIAWVSDLGPITCAIAGVQFAFHPENLILTLAAATDTATGDLVPTLVTTVWFTAVGVCSVAVPTIFYARSGDGARRTLERVRDWIVARGTLVTAVLLFVVGAALLIVGVVRLT